MQDYFSAMKVWLYVTCGIVTYNIPSSLVEYFGVEVFEFEAFVKIIK